MCHYKQVTALNVTYSDSGLFGFYTASDGSSSGKVGQRVCSEWKEYSTLHLLHTYSFPCEFQLLKAVMKEFNEVAKGSISEDDLTRAKLVSVIPKYCTRCHSACI